MPNGIPSLPVHGEQLKKILLVEPRSVRHNERISDLMYVLFRRSDS